MGLRTFYKELETSLQKTLLRERILIRPGAGPGIWLLFLLPVAVIVTSWRSQSKSALYTSCSIFSVNLILNAMHLLYHIFYKKSIHVTSSLNVLCAVPFCCTIFLYNHFLDFDLKSLSHTVANALMYFEGLPFLLKVFPKSFTFGEANILMQAISLFMYSTFLNLQERLSKVPTDTFQISSVILQVGLLGIFILCTVAYAVKKIQNTFLMYLWGTIVVAGFIVPALQQVLQQNAVLWLLNFILETDRINLLLLWGVCSIAAAFGISHQIKTKKQASTVVRKYFHILSAVVYVSGVISDALFLRLSSGIVLAIFIVLEVFRVLKLPPLHQFLQDGFKAYADEKDVGNVAFTPIYLLLGCALPLFLHPDVASQSKSNYLALLSGVLCIGIGDTCASVFGKQFGRHHWKSSRKTIEGTISCILGQVAAIGLLVSQGFVPNCTTLLVKSLTAVVIVSLVEAKTDQVDNIVLPLLMYCLLMV